MLPVREIAFVICIIFYLKMKTFQKELGIGYDADSDDWSQMKWDSILKDLSSIDKSDSSSKDYTNNLDPLFSFENEPNFKSKAKLSESELENLSEDEVFIAESKDNHKKAIVKKSIKYEKQTDQENSFNLAENKNEFPSKSEHASVEEINADSHNQSNESKVSSSKLDNSQLLLSNTQGVNSIVQQTDVDNLNPRSFIFNPNANPKEQFQNCTTPKNESGSCRYLQHCMIPTIVSSLNQFMDYVCIIDGRFIGVCCPNFPVSVVMVKEEKGDSEVESNPGEECGVGTNTRIVGGSKADPKAWPWMVALFSKFRKNFFCGGALINDRYVLTAAHCTFGVLNNEIIARIGEYDFKSDGGTHDDFAVVEMKRHGHYNRRTLQNDIALLKLEKPVVFNEFMKPICFPEEEKNYVAEKATLAGWGNIAGGGRTSNILLEASFPVISNQECSIGHGLPIADSLICTGAESGDKGACNGDSGGPLMLLDRNNRWKAIGLVSWGRRGCNPEFPTVYTRVSHFLEWIRKYSR